MIQSLNIRNFKSIKDMALNCKKLNVFIGEPNSGKSNIIEALALLSQNITDDSLNKNMFRYKTIGDLFFDFEVHNAIEVNLDESKSLLRYGNPENTFTDDHFYLISPYLKEHPSQILMEHTGKMISISNPDITNISYYKYRHLSGFKLGYSHNLMPPHGDNLPSLLLSNKDLKKWVSDFMKSKGLKLTLKPTEKEIEASKLVDDEIYSFPYFAISETLQRIIFYTLAITSNHDSIILFDEPDSNTFPVYTKLLAERIALDDSNQFFITTHNPYLLLSLIEKSKKEDINVCITRMKNYETTISVLNDKQISEVLNLTSDVFFNFDKIINL